MPAQPSKRATVKLYDRNLGGALRAAGRTEFGREFDAVPLIVGVNVPVKIARDLSSEGMLFQRALSAVSPAVQKMVRDKIAPALDPKAKVDQSLRSTVERILTSQSQSLYAPLEAVIAQHYQTLGEWLKLKRENAVDGTIITVTLTLSAAAFGLAGFTAGVSGAAAIIGLARGVIDGCEKLVACWSTTDEWRVRIAKEVDVLNKAYDRGATAGRAMQVGGGVLRNSGVGKAVASMTGRDWTPSIASIEKNLTTYRGKIGHLYGFLDKMSVRLKELVILSQAKSDPRLTSSIATLLEGEGTARGRLHGFRGRYTIPDGFLLCETGWSAADQLGEALKKLTSRDARASAVAKAVTGAEFVTNLGFSAINYPLIFQGSSPAATMFGVDGGAAATTAASFGLFNDAVGVLKDLSGMVPDLGGGDAAAKAKEDEVRLDFCSVPSTATSLPSRSASLRQVFA